MITSTTEPMRRPCKDGDEVDAFSRSARRALCSLQRAGVVHRTKTRAARRARRSTRQGMRATAAAGQNLLHLATTTTDLDAILEAYDALV